MSERQKQHQGRSAGDESEIPGRDFAGTEFAADQNEQTRTHRGERNTTDESGESAVPSEGGKDPGRRGETDRRGEL